MTTDTTEPTETAEPTADVQTEPTTETPTPDTAPETETSAAEPAGEPEPTPVADARPATKTFGEIAETRMARLAALREATINAAGRYEKAKNYAKAAKEEWEEERAVFEKEFDDVIRLMKGDVDLPLFQDLNKPALPKGVADLVALLKTIDYDIDPIVAGSFTLDDQSQIRIYVKREAERRQLVADGKTEEAARVLVPPVPTVLRREETEPPAGPGEVVTGTFAEAGPFASAEGAADAPVEVHGEAAPEAANLYERIVEDVVLRDETALTLAVVDAWAPEDRVRVSRWISGGPNQTEPPACIAPFLAPIDDGPDEDETHDEDANDGEPEDADVDRETEDSPL
jgi:hypothetical protein